MQSDESLEMEQINMSLQRRITFTDDATFENRDDFVEARRLAAAAAAMPSVKDKVLLMDETTSTVETQNEHKPYTAKGLVMIGIVTTLLSASVAGIIAYSMIQGKLYTPAFLSSHFLKAGFFPCNGGVPVILDIPGTGYSVFSEALSKCRSLTESSLSTPVSLSANIVHQLSEFFFC